MAGEVAAVPAAHSPPPHRRKTIQNAAAYCASRGTKCNRKNKGKKSWCNPFPRWAVRWKVRDARGEGPFRPGPCTRAAERRSSRSRALENCRLLINSSVLRGLRRFQRKLYPKVHRFRFAHSEAEMVPGTRREDSGAYSKSTNYISPDYLYSRTLKMPNHHLLWIGRGLDTMSHQFSIQHRWAFKFPPPPPAP